MAFQKGNKHAAHPKPWTRALQMHAQQNPDLLKRLAIATFDAAIAGDAAARKELGERLDGKPVQQIEHSGSISQTAEQLTDDQLAAIAAGSSAGIVEQTEGPQSIN